MKTTTISISVSLAGPRPYAGAIIGTDEKYGFSLEFLPLTKMSRTLHRAEITKPGQYKVMAGAVVGSRRIDTGYITVAADGSVSEVQKGDIKLAQ